MQILGKNILLVQILGKIKVPLSQPASYKEDGSVTQCFLLQIIQITLLGCLQRDRSSMTMLFCKSQIPIFQKLPTFNFNSTKLQLFQTAKYSCFWDNPQRLSRVAQRFASSLSCNCLQSSLGLNTKMLHSSKINKEDFKLLCAWILLERVN